jgi:dTDP-4-amino-4,6-dideoxygalactose transaminase
MLHIVTEFEQKIAEFFGAKYAVATDCCTHAIELRIRYKNYCDYSDLSRMDIFK